MPDRRVVFSLSPIDPDLRATSVLSVLWTAVARSSRSLRKLGDGEHAVIIRGGLIYSDIVVVQGALAPSGAR